jgi:integrase
MGMKKTWLHQRKGLKGWWVGWYEGGKRKAKAFPSKALAEHFQQVKYAQLNSDVYTSIVNVDWRQMLAEYEQSKRVAGLKDPSTYEALLTLQHFESIAGPCASKQITQAVLDNFVLVRSQEKFTRNKKKPDSGKQITRSTLNKDIRNLRTFLNWAAERRYVNGDLKIVQLKTEQAPVVSLSLAQVKELLSAASAYPGWRMRVLLALTTGLRRGDVGRLCVGDVRVDRNAITTRSRKTGKAMGERPVPEGVMTELINYIATLPEGQERLFNTFTSQKWEKIRERAGLPDLKFHDLRKTFASALAQTGVSTAVTQRLLEHATPRLTNDVYTNVDPVLRHAIDRLPTADWLK